MRIQVYTGERPMREFREVMAELGWGEMRISLGPPPEGTLWALDNGAFQAARDKTPFDGQLFMERVWDAYHALAAAYTGEFRQERHGPDFCVVPDAPILDNDLSPEERRRRATSSLLTSLAWMDGRALPLEWPWMLAVQDGMDRDEVREVIEETSCGLFLGGSDRFKREEAHLWSRLAHSEGVPFHYGRAGSGRKLLHAYHVGADSCDSNLFLWSRPKFYRFVRQWKQLGVQQMLALTGWE